MTLEEAREPASEQIPLLRAPDGDTPLPKEASPKELIWILGSIWLGVFLAALGMRTSIQSLFIINVSS